MTNVNHLLFDTCISNLTKQLSYMNEILKQNNYVDLLYHDVGHFSSANGRWLRITANYFK